MIVTASIVLFLLGTAYAGTGDGGSINVTNACDSGVYVTWSGTGCFGVYAGDTLVCDHTLLAPGSDHYYGYNGGVTATWLNAGHSDSASASWDVANHHSVSADADKTMYCRLSMVDGACKVTECTAGAKGPLKPVEMFAAMHVQILPAPVIVAGQGKNTFQRNELVFDLNVAKFGTAGHTFYMKLEVDGATEEEFEAPLEKYAGIEILGGHHVMRTSLSLYYCRETKTGSTMTAKIIDDATKAVLATGVGSFRCEFADLSGLDIDIRDNNYISSGVLIITDGKLNVKAGSPGFGRSSLITVLIATYYEQEVLYRGLAINFFKSLPSGGDFLDQTVPFKGSWIIQELHPHDVRVVIVEIFDPITMITIQGQGDLVDVDRKIDL